MAEKVIRVFARFRPPLFEDEVGQPFCVKFQNNSILIFHDKLNKTLQFDFDGSFSPTASQADVYAKIGSPLLDDVFNGYNCTLLTYGQTGSGKSYTMEGKDFKGQPDKPGEKDDPQNGIVPRLIKDIYARIAASTDANTSFEVEASFVEVYRGELVDCLLTSASPDSKVEVRFPSQMAANSNQPPKLSGQTKRVCATETELRKLYKTGSKGRVVECTNANPVSSRGHGVFDISIKQTLGQTSTRTSLFRLVDLAGSEQADNTGQDAGRMREAKAINQSLAFLGGVVLGLSQGEKFINYRRDLLTRVLEESLSNGNKAILVVTGKPTSSNVKSTLNSLRFASTAAIVKGDFFKNERQTRAQLEQGIFERDHKLHENSKELASLKEKLRLLQEMIDKGEYSQQQPRARGITQVLATQDALNKAQHELREAQKNLTTAENDLQVARQALQEAEARNDTQAIKARSEELKAVEERVSAFEAALEVCNTQYLQEAGPNPFGDVGVDDPFGANPFGDGLGFSGSAGADFEFPSMFEGGGMGGTDYSNNPFASEGGGNPFEVTGDRLACRQCGLTDMEPGEKFCYECGAPLLNSGLARQLSSLEAAVKEAEGKLSPTEYNLHDYLHLHSQLEANLLSACPNQPVFYDADNLSMAMGNLPEDQEWLEEDCVPEPSVMCELPLRSRDGYEHKSGKLNISGLMSVLTSRQGKLAEPWPTCRDSVYWTCGYCGTTNLVSASLCASCKQGKRVVPSSSSSSSAPLSISTTAAAAVISLPPSPSSRFKVKEAASFRSKRAPPPPKETEKDAVRERGWYTAYLELSNELRSLMYFTRNRDGLWLLTDSFPLSQAHIEPLSAEDYAYSEMCFSLHTRGRVPWICRALTSPGYRQWLSLLQEKASVWAADERKARLHHEQQSKVLISGTLRLLRADGAGWQQLFTQVRKKASGLSIECFELGDNLLSEGDLCFCMPLHSQVGRVSLFDSDFERHIFCLRKKSSSVHVSSPSSPSASASASPPSGILTRLRNVSTSSRAAPPPPPKAQSSLLQTFPVALEQDNSPSCLVLMAESQRELDRWVETLKLILELEHSAVERPVGCMVSRNSFMVPGSIKEGPLRVKSNKRFSNWRPRYGVLSRGQLYLYKGKHGPAGRVFVVEQCELVVATVKKQQTFTLSPRVVVPSRHSNRFFTFAADQQEDFDDWVAQLQKCQSTPQSTPASSAPATPRPSH